MGKHIKSGIATEQNKGKQHNSQKQRTVSIKGYLADHLDGLQDLHDEWAKTAGPVMKKFFGPKRKTR